MAKELGENLSGTVDSVVDVGKNVVEQRQALVKSLASLSKQMWGSVKENEQVRLMRLQLAPLLMPSHSTASHY